MLIYVTIERVDTQALWMHERRLSRVCCAQIVLKFRCANTNNLASLVLVWDPPGSTASGYLVLSLFFPSARQKWRCGSRKRRRKRRRRAMMVLYLERGLAA
eukprot:1166010-Rhodomonas_salina.1